MGVFQGGGERQGPVTSWGMGARHALSLALPSFSLRGLPDMTQTGNMLQSGANSQTIEAKAIDTAVGFPARLQQESCARNNAKRLQRAREETPARCVPCSLHHSHFLSFTAAVWCWRSVSSRSLGQSEAVVEVD